MVNTENFDHMSTVKQCPGKFCKGKELPLSRFEKNKDSNDGRRRMCKMCIANRNNPNFIKGKCEFCKKNHDCSFGTARFCSRACATNRKANYLTVNDKRTHKVCTRDNCVHGGKEQPIKNFYKRTDGTRSLRRSQCKDCQLFDVRKHQTTFGGFIKNSYYSAKRRARNYGREFTITIEDLTKLHKKQHGNFALRNPRICLSSSFKTGRYPKVL